MHAGGADDGTISTDEFSNAGAGEQPKRKPADTTENDPFYSNGQQLSAPGPAPDSDAARGMALSARLKSGQPTDIAPLPDTGLLGMFAGSAAEGFGNIGTGLESLGRTVARNNVIPGMGAVPQPIPQPAPAPYTPIAQPLVDWGQHEMDLSNSATIPRFGAYLAGQALPFMAAAETVPEALLPEGAGIAAKAGRGFIKNAFGSGAVSPQGQRLKNAGIGGVIGATADAATNLLTPARTPADMGQGMPLVPPESSELPQTTISPAMQPDALKTAPIAPLSAGLAGQPAPSAPPIDLSGPELFIRDAQGSPIPNAKPTIPTKGVQANGEETAVQGGQQEIGADAQGADQRAQDRSGNGENPPAVPGSEEVLTTDQFANLGNEEEPALAPASAHDAVNENIPDTLTPPESQATAASGTTAPIESNPNEQPPAPSGAQENIETAAENRESLAGTPKQLGDEQRGTSDIAPSNESGTSKSQEQAAPEPEPTGIKNSVVDRELAAMEAGPAQHGAAATMKEAWENAKETAANDPRAGEKLMDTLEKNPRPATKEENALLVHERVRLSNERNAAQQDVIDAEKTGDKGQIEIAKAARDAAQEKFKRASDIVTVTGTHSSHSLGFRKIMAKLDYSQAQMEMDQRAAMGGRELNPRDRYELDAAHARITRLEKDFQDYVAQKQAEETKRTAEQTPKADKNFGRRNKVFTADKAQAARQQLRDAMSRLNVGLDPGLVKPLVDLGGYYVEGGLREFGAWSKAMADDLGEKVRPHLQDIWDQTQTAFNASQQEKKAAASLKGFKTRQANRATEYETKAAAGDFQPKPKSKPLELDPEAMRLKANADRAKQDWEAKLKKYRDANKSIPQKAADKFLQIYRMNLISGPGAIGKILSGDAVDAVMKPYTEAVGGLISKILPDLAARAPREGGFSPAAEKAAITIGLPQGLRDIPKVLKTGQTDRDVLYGGGRIASGLTNIPGRLHGALRAVPEAMEYNRSIVKRNAAGQKEPGQAAYADSMRAAQLEDNPITNAIKAFQGTLAAPDKITGKPTAIGKAAAFASRLEMPIIKIPVNIMAQTLENIYGAPVGAARAWRAYAQGIKDLPPAQGDMIMRQIKKGSAVGIPLMMLGFLNRKNVGGFYQPGEKRQRGDVPAGALRVGGHVIPAWTQVNPYSLTMQFGATIGRIMDSMHKGEHPGVTESVMKSMLGVADELPFFRMSKDIENLRENPAKAVREKARDVLIPQAIQAWARNQDTNSLGNTVKRVPQTFPQALESGIPYLRKNVPLPKNAQYKP